MSLRGRIVEVVDAYLLVLVSLAVLYLTAIGVAALAYSYERRVSEVLSAVGATALFGVEGVAWWAWAVVFVAIGAVLLFPIGLYAVHVHRTRERGR